MVKAISYIRFSTAAQADGDSIRRQTEAARRYAAANGLELDEGLVFEDLGLSGFKGKNRTEGALGGFINKVEDGTIPPGSYLLVENLDRLSREQVSRAFRLFSEILDRGITVVTLTDGRVYTKESLNASFSDLLIFLSIAFRAFEESAIKSHRGKASWKAKRANANEKKMTALCPAWMRLNGDRSGFELIHDKAEIVRRIFRMYLDGMGKIAIASKLNEDGVPPLGKADGWHHSYTAKILVNRSAIGCFQPHRTVEVDGKRRDLPDGPEIVGYYPAAVDRDTFYRAQKQRQDKALPRGRRGKRYTNLLRGLAVCGECGGTMHLISKGRRRSTAAYPNVYLQCANARRKAAKCHHTTLWPYEAVEHFVTCGISDIDFSSLFPGITEGARQALAKAETERDAAEGEKREIERQLGNILHVLADRPGSPALLGQLDQLEIRKHELSEMTERLAVEVTVAKEQLSTTQKRFDIHGELLEQWRQAKDDAALRSKLNRSLTANIKRMEMHSHGAGTSLGFIKTEFRPGARHWTIAVDRQPTRGYYRAVSAPFDQKDYSMVSGVAEMWFPEGTGPDD